MAGVETKGYISLDDLIRRIRKYHPEDDMELVRKLQRMGHNIRPDLSTPSFGRGQMIVRLDNGTLVGGTESRTDSNIACY